MEHSVLELLDEIQRCQIKLATQMSFVEETRLLLEDMIASSHQYLADYKAQDRDH